MIVFDESDNKKTRVTDFNVPISFPVKTELTYGSVPPARILSDADEWQFKKDLALAVVKDVQWHCKREGWMGYWNLKCVVTGKITMPIKRDDQMYAKISVTNCEYRKLVDVYGWKEF